MRAKFALLVLVGPVTLSGCGAYVPENHLFLDPSEKLAPGVTPEGNFQNAIAIHIKCEIAKGILRVASDKHLSRKVPWLFELEPVTKPVTQPATQSLTVEVSDPRHPEKKIWKTETRTEKKTETTLVGWGTAVSMQLQVEEQTLLNPGVGVTEPLHNAYAFVAGPNSYPLTPTSLAAPTISAIPQNFNIGIGVTANSHATRQETIQFTLDNAKLLHFAQDGIDDAGNYSCDDYKKISPFLIESNLKIDEFIYDKAVAASLHNVSNLQDKDGTENWAPFNTFQEIITFVAEYGAGVTPTWKFTRITANPNTPTASIQRNEINTIVITLGQEDRTKPPTPVNPLTLAADAQSQHNAASQAALIATATRALTP